MSTPPTVGRGRRLSFAAFGLLLALGVGLLWWALAHQVGEPPSPAGARHTAAASAPSGDTGTENTPGSPEPTGESGDPGVSEPPAGAEAPASTPGSTPEEQPDDNTVTPLAAADPVRVSIPAIGVDSAVHSLGLDAAGALQVPRGDRYDEAAWYDGSPTPGEAGPAVIEGHVTSQGSIPSVFFELGALEPGDQVEVERVDGSTATFEVYGAKSFPKDSFPKATVYGNTRGAELRLITCGGDYDTRRGAHVDNIVVFARLVDPTGAAR